MLSIDVRLSEAGDGSDRLDKLKIRSSLLRPLLLDLGVRSQVA